MQIAVKAALSTIVHLLLTGLTVYVFAWAALLRRMQPSAVNDRLPPAHPHAPGKLN